jgi:hypothetical protein
MNHAHLAQKTVELVHLQQTIAVMAIVLRMNHVHLVQKTVELVHHLVMTPLVFALIAFVGDFMLMKYVRQRISCGVAVSIVYG